MADIATYLAAVAALPDVLAVGTHSFIDTDSAGVTLCEVPVTELNEGGTAAIRKTMKFYVTDYEGPSEKCYDFKKEPTPELNPAAKFADIALDWLYTQGHADVAEIISLDETRKKVRARLYVQTNTTDYEVKEAICWKDNGTAPEIRFLPAGT